MANTRPLVVGPASGPESPFPLQMEGEVIKGFGRGSKEGGGTDKGDDEEQQQHAHAHAHVQKRQQQQDQDQEQQAAESIQDRGVRQLGIPTANLPVDATVTPWISDAKSGVYFGWAALELGKDHPNYKPPSSSSPPAGQGESGENKGGFCIFPMVMSIGYNPFYNNTVRSAEVHVLDKFAADFYGVNMRLLIVGYIRDEKNYEGLEALIEDINTDCEVARRSLEREAWKLAGQQGGTLDASWLTR